MKPTTPKEQLEALRGGLTIIATTTYPARYIGRRDDGVEMYGESDDAARFARKVLAANPPLPPKPDECVPMLTHEDTCKRLRNLYDAALDARHYLRGYDAALARAGRIDEMDHLGTATDRLDAALADAQEVLP